jgi:multidrug efflux system membrane fusion protein
MRHHQLGGVMLVAGLLGCGGDPRPARPPLPVTVAQVEGAGSDEGSRYAGAIQPDLSVDVAFRVSGVVEGVTQVRGADGRMRSLQDGDTVGRGDTLAWLRQDEHQDQVADAEAGLRQALADFERASQLFENRSISKADYDAAYARYTTGRARANQARTSLADATLRSPLDGVILRRSTEAGSLAGPSAPGFTIANTRNVKVVFGVPDVILGRLRTGGTLDIAAEALPGVRLIGRITRIAPSADPSSRVFEVEAALPNRDGRLRVGMLATLELGEHRGPELLVPLAALVRPAGDSTGYAVYVVEASASGTTARLRRISLGTAAGNRIAVKEGLESSDRVILRGATLVTDGQPVAIIP